MQVGEKRHQEMEVIVNRLRLALLLVLVLVGPSARSAIHLRAMASGFNAPTLVTAAGDGSGRLFVLEQAGLIRIISNGSVLPQPFLDIRDEIISGGETGLLGLAFHPDYRDNGRFFVNYTRPSGPTNLETAVSEFSVDPGNPNQAVRSSEKILLTIAQPFPNHKGGMLAFGPDGDLYIGVGDGGSGGDPLGNGQNVNTLLGKILRIDVNSGVPYGIPPDNPFASGPGADEIFAFGFRNPWRFSFDRATGRMFIGDVGQDMFEEVDIGQLGGNYGWNRMEGSHCYSPPSGCDMSGLVLPIHDYSHADGISITGGYVYRGSSVPSLIGKYLYSDFGSGTLWALSDIGGGQWRNEVLLQTGLSVSSFGQDDSGELYIVDYSGSIQQIVSDGAEPAINQNGIVSGASFLLGTVAPGEIVSIFGTGTGPTDLVGAQLDSTGKLSTHLANTTVWFGNTSAALFAVTANQVNAQVPYEVDGKTSTTVQVQVNDQFSNPIPLDVAAAAPALFAIAQGTGQAAIMNTDQLPNSASNPAARGSVVSLFATGEGQIRPAGVDGQLSMQPYPSPIASVSVTIGGAPAEVAFSGSAPGFAGLLQVNARVPTSISTGAAVPVELKIGGVSSQPGLTMAVN